MATQLNAFDFDYDARQLIWHDEVSGAIVTGNQTDHYSLHNGNRQGIC